MPLVLALVVHDINIAEADELCTLQIYTKSPGDYFEKEVKAWSTSKTMPQPRSHSALDSTVCFMSDRNVAHEGVAFNGV